MEKESESEDSSGRRGFVRTLVKVAALGGLATVLLGQPVEKASAAGAANQIAFYQSPDVLVGSDSLRWDDAGRNFVAGYSGNTVMAGALGATISGGGTSGFINQVTDDYGTVGGGRNNQAGDGGSTPDKLCATVGGGSGNIASGSDATVSGGWGNTASNQLSTVGGGHSNTASGYSSTVPGGDFNMAAGDYSFAAGQRAKINTDHDGAFLFADSSAFDFNSAAANEFAVLEAQGS
jgi:hypothetical protein